MPKLNYEASMKQLETIVRRMESGELSIDALGKELSAAQQLIKQCRAFLTSTEEEIQKLINHDTIPETDN